MSTLIARAYQASQQWLALGHESIATPRARLVRDRGVPRIYDANFAANVRAESPGDIDAVLHELDRAFDGFHHRHVLWDPDTPPPLEARLVLDGWRQHNDLVTLVLEGDLQANAPSTVIRAAETDADWQTIEDLHWLDHEEEVAMGFHAPWDRTLTNELVASKRRKSPDAKRSNVDDVKLTSNAPQSGTLAGRCAGTGTSCRWRGSRARDVVNAHRSGGPGHERLLGTS